MHECIFCGYYCDCDGEDIDQPQTEDCTHICDDECEDDDE
jgi:hypothetical protein